MKLRYYVLLIGLVVFSPLQAGSVDWALKDLQATQEAADVAFVEGDYKKARKLYYQLAYVGNKYAQYKLSIIYMHGYEVDQNWPRAYAWAHTAAEFGQDSLVQHKKAVWQRIPEGQQEKSRVIADKYMEQYNDKNIARVLWIKARQKDLKSIGRGHMNDSMVSVQTPCDDPSAQSTIAVGSGPAALAEEVCGGMYRRGENPALTMLKLESIQRLMKTRYEGGIVELRDFEVIDEDIVDDEEEESED